MNQIESLTDLKVLVIGDTIIDEYHYIKSLGKSSKSPTLSTQFVRAEVFAGGVLAIANHLNEFAGEVHLVTCLGTENDQLDIIEEKISEDIKTRYFYRNDGPTPAKRRYIAEYMNAKVFEVTYMNDEDLEKSLEAEMIASFSSQTQYFRFFGFVPHVSKELLRRSTQIDYDREIAIIAEVRENGRKKMAGEVRLLADADNEIAEFAIAVADQWHGLGLGRKLTDYIISIAAERGIRKIYANVLKANSIMVEMFRRRGFSLTSADHSTYFAELKVGKTTTEQL